jgi:hypothetical protein
VGEAINPAQGLLAVTLAGPAVLGGENQHQGGTIAQGVTEETAGAGGIEALAVGSIRFTLAFVEEVLLAAGAVRSGEQGLAIGGELQGGLQDRKGWVLGPGG